MKRNIWRPVASITVLVVTIAAFTYYFVTHPTVREQLSQTSISLLVLLLSLYLLGVGALALVTHATLRLCRLNLGKSESLLLTAYSSVVNFFGPLQSGPAFRAVYLKQKHDVSLKQYTGATLVYYFFYGAISAMFLLSGILKWWLLTPIIIGVLVAVVALRSRRFGPRLKQLNLHSWYYLALATLLQIIIVTFIYFAELRSVAPATSFSQAVIYSGAANLSLFVSLTPGAIGFRESFLLFSQRLHHIDAATIVTVNILDRAVYISLLLILAFFIFATHAQRRLKQA